MAVPVPTHARRQSARSYLAFFAAALALPILLFASLLLWQYGTRERARLEQAALEEARDIAQAVDGELGDLLSSARILALTPAVRFGRHEEYHDLTLNMHRTLGMISVLRNPDGQQVVSPLMPFGSPLPKVNLPTDRSVLATKEPMVSDLFTGGVSQAPLFTVTVPVLRDDGEVRHLLNLSFPVDRLRNLIAREQPPSSWVVAIVDRGGTIMARNSRHDDFVGKPATPDLQEHTKGLEGTWNGFSADGREVFGAYSRSRLADWRIAVGVQRSDLAGPLQRSLWWLAALGVGLFALSALLAALFGQRITAPIEALAQKAAAIGRGEAVEAVDTPVGEIRRVGEALATASVQLREREAALRTSEERLRLAIDAGRMAVWETVTRAGSGAVTSSPELNRLLGFPPEASPTIEEIRGRYAPGVREHLQAAVADALGRGERYAEEELEVIWPDGSRHWIQLRANLEVVTDQGGAAGVRATGVAFDITARKRWEEHQHLLINELNHRVKNTLATVQSVASQSLRNASSLDEAREALEERLLALSRAHNVLTRENWESADLREVVAQAVEPYGGAGEDRLHLAGPQVRLPPRMALALAMALQELATNAVKYGALSNETGRIAITWSPDDSSTPPRLHLRWQESGGPPVRTPTRRGFGTRLIERSLAQDLDGEVRISFEPEGLVCTVDAPIG